MFDTLDPGLVHEERMRYQVLNAIYQAANRYPCVRVDSREFRAAAGGWPKDVERLLGHLARCGFVTLGEESLGAIREEGNVACITQRGVDYIQRDARRRKTVR